MCGCDESKGKTTYVCTACGKEELKDEQGTCDVKSCCGQPMKKKEE